MDIYKAAFYLQVMDELRLRHGISTTVEDFHLGPDVIHKFIRATQGKNQIDFYHTCGNQPELLVVQWVGDSTGAGDMEWLDGRTWPGTDRATWPEVFEVANEMRKWFETSISNDFEML